MVAQHRGITTNMYRTPSLMPSPKVMALFSLFLAMRPRHIEAYAIPLRSVSSHAYPDRGPSGGNRGGEAYSTLLSKFSPATRSGISSSSASLFSLDMFW